LVFKLTPITDFHLFPVIIGLLTKPIQTKSLPVLDFSAFKNHAILSFLSKQFLQKFARNQQIV
jgi:hypothetical protein